VCATSALSDLFQENVPVLVYQIAPVPFDGKARTGDTFGGTSPPREPPVLGSGELGVSGKGGRTCDGLLAGAVGGNSISRCWKCRSGQGVVDIAGAVAVVRAILRARPVSEVGIPAQDDIDGVLDRAGRAEVLYARIVDDFVALADDDPLQQVVSGITCIVLV
jgi:hypothetical protein